jgi:glycosyltransferase involved in cell wall biosynthesis
MLKAADRVEIFAYLDPIATPPPDLLTGRRFGAFRAQWSQVEAVANFATGCDLNIVCDDSRAALLTNILDSHDLLNAKVVRISDLISAPPKQSRHHLVHHFGQLFEAIPFRIRDLLGSNCPVTFSHHSLGYAYLRDAAQVLRRHSRSSQDACIASSEAAAKVIRDIVHCEVPDWLGDVLVTDLPATGRPPNAEERALARSALGLAPTTICLLSVGRLSPHDKASLEPLIWAFGKLQNNRKDVVLIIAGEDRHDYAREVTRLSHLYSTAEKVKVLTNLADDEVRTCHAAADVFVSLYDSQQESFGIAVAEALRRGLPSVVSSYSGISELVQNGQTGFLVPTETMIFDGLSELWKDYLPWDEEHLRQSQLVSVDRYVLLKRLQLLASNATLRSTMSSAAANDGERRFSSRSVATNLEAIWRGRLRPPEGLRRIDPPPSLSDASFTHFTSTTIRPACFRSTDDGAFGHLERVSPGILKTLGIQTHIEVVMGALSEDRRHWSFDELLTQFGLTNQQLQLCCAVLKKYDLVESFQ